MLGSPTTHHKQRLGFAVLAVLTVLIVLALCIVVVSDSPAQASISGGPTLTATQTYTPTATPTMSCTSASFKPAVNYASGASPNSVAVGDFNEDTQLDVVVANARADNVAVFMGKGNGTFQSPVNYQLGTEYYPYALAVGDLDGDTHPDIAVANGNAGSVSVLINNGDGAFRPPVTYAAGFNPQSVAMGDFNGDTHLDLALGNNLSANVSVLINNGNGTFQTAVNYAVGTHPQIVVVADFNEDMHTDLAVTNTSSNNVSILMGSGDGTFQSAVSYTTGDSPLSLAAEDFNRDTHVDLVVTNYSSSSVSILIGTGKGTFETPVSYPSEISPFSVAVSDFNSDSHSDLAVANLFADNVSVLMGLGDGSFIPSTEYEVDAAPRWVAAGDFNGDARPDLATANSDSNNISILLNTCKSPINTPTPLSSKTPGSTATTTNTPTIPEPTTTLTPVHTTTHLPTCTPTGTFTPSPTNTPCDYYYATATGTIVPGTLDIGNHTDDGVTKISLPFPFYLYGQVYTSANVSSNGNLQFTTSSTAYVNTCLPNTELGTVILAHWDDLLTNGIDCAGECGIFTSISGNAPNRTFNIEWRTTYFSGAGYANFEIRLYEYERIVDVIIGVLDQGGTSATIGVQLNTQFTQYECNTSAPNNTRIRFQQFACTGHGPTFTPTRPTDTPTVTLTPTNGPCFQSIHEGFESGTLGIFTSSGSPGWSASTATPHSGSYSAYAPDVASVSDQRLTISSPIVVPVNATQAEFSFWHRYDLDANGTTAFDGGVFEASTNGGTTWSNTGFLQGPYTHLLVSCPNQNPLAGRAAWSGDSGGWVQTRGSLLQFRGRSVLLRFRLGTSESNGGGGWWIDDFNVTFSQSACFSPTPPQEPSDTPTMTASSTLTVTGTPPTATLTRTPCNHPIGEVHLPAMSCTDWNPLHYDYSFVLAISGCPSAHASGFNRAQFSEYEGGPWTTLQEQVFDGEYSASTYITGTFTLDSPPAQYSYFRLEVEGVVGPNFQRFYNATGTRELCELYTPTVTPTGTPCKPVNFSDVNPTDYFYEGVHYLYCTGAVSGYSDGTFRPYNNTSRGQMCKIVVLGEGWAVDCPSWPSFTDVPTDHPFYCFVETAYNHGIISGYPGPAFLPGNDVTRGQLCKMIVLAEQWQIDCPTQPHFTDVPPDNPFYCFIETAYAHGILTGYSDGTFRWGNNATRGQICKIVYNAIMQP